jgi:glycyl-tRNA synthetase beta subunit
LRRAALGVIRIILENRLGLPLGAILNSCYDSHVFKEREGFFLFLYAISEGGYEIEESVPGRLIRAAISRSELQNISFPVAVLAKFNERPSGFPPAIPSYLRDFNSSRQNDFDFVDD